MAASSTAARARTEWLALQEKIAKCRQEAQGLARRHRLAGKSLARLDEGLGEAVCGIQEILDNSLTRK